MHHISRLSEKYIHELFVVGLILKGISSTFEIISGVFLLFTGSITAFLTFMIQAEVNEDPSGWIASYLQSILPFFSSHSQLYASFYLLSHGIIKIILVISLLLNKLWAYPATIASLMLFIAYQLYRLVYGYSLFLILLTIFDIILIILTWHEYNIIKTHPRFAPPTPRI
jgi:uncharacterized membrane protein